ncbi:MAG: hypothetical protein ACRDD2_10700 [Sarcina sp.]
MGLNKKIMVGVAAVATVVTVTGGTQVHKNNEGNKVLLTSNDSYVQEVEQVKEGVNQARVKLGEKPLGEDTAFAFEDGQNYCFIPAVNYQNSKPSYASFTVTTAGSNTLASGMFNQLGNEVESSSQIVAGQAMHYGLQNVYLNVLGNSTCVVGEANIIPLTYFVQTEVVTGLKVGVPYKYTNNSQYAGTVIPQEGTGAYKGKVVIQICANKGANIAILNENGTVNPVNQFELTLAGAIIKNIPIQYTKNVDKNQYPYKFR